jgi:hypothetical protein
MLNYSSLQILTLKKYSSRKVLFFINLHMLNTKFIIQGLSELADQNNTVNSSSSGNNRKNVQKNLS